LTVHYKDREGERERFGIKMYVFCDRSLYTYDMGVYLGKQANVASADVTPTLRTLELV
jgi:hypothetical protein